MSPSDSLTPVAPSTPKEASQMALKVPFDEDETKELLLCFMYILKNLEQGKNLALMIIISESNIESQGRIPQKF